MLCDICKEREASLHLQQKRQNKVIQYHLCEHCAREQGLGQQIKGYFGHMFGGSVPGIGNIFNPAGGIPEFGQPISQDLSCSHCGQTYNDFRKTGKFGCSHCYQAFADRLDPVFRRVQGNVRHQGRSKAKNEQEMASQAKQDRLDQLRRELRQVVNDEDYETAAHLRDEIHALEKNLEAKGGEGG